MKRRALLTAAAIAPIAPGPIVTGPITAARAQSGKPPIVLWHALTGPNADALSKFTTAFNASQSDAEVQPVFKGGYADVLTAAIAAWRADQAPHLVQIFEVGTGSMLAAGPATKQVWKPSLEIPTSNSGRLPRSRKPPAQRIEFSSTAAK